MRSRLVALVLALAAARAFAAPPTSGAVTLAPDGKVVIAGPPCPDLIAGANYVPGVDVHGNAVAPADLPAGAPPAVTAESPAVRIDARLAGRFGVPQGGAYGAKAILGYVTVRDGRAYFNGAPLAPDASAALAQACRAAKK